ncbi:hypothetical protein AKO1_007536, partial [Acrasis kona]
QKMKATEPTNEDQQLKIKQQIYEQSLRNAVPLSEIENKARCLFTAIDQDKSNSIDADEMAAFLKTNGIFLDRSSFQSFIKRYDSDNDGSINWSEFWTLIREQENQIRSVFMEMDADRSGTLDEEESLAALHRFGIPATKAQVQDWIKQISQPGTGRVTYKEWYNYLHTQQFFGEKLSHISLGELWEDWKIRRASGIIIDGNGTLLISEYDNIPWSHPKWKYMAGGAIAASLSRTLTAPLDRLRCLLQVQTMKHAMSTNPLDMKSSWQMLKEMGSNSNDGIYSRIRGYYRGNLMAVAKIAPEIAIRNFFFEHLKGLFVKLDPESNKTMDLEWHERFISIGVSSVAAAATLYPFEYLKTSLQMTKRERTVSEILRAEIKCKAGWRHMFTGLSPSLIRVAGDVSVYETFKKIHYERNKAHEDPTKRYPSVVELLGMGSLACGVAQTVSYPLLFVRTIIQAQACKEIAPGGIKFVPYKGTMDAFRQIIKREGVRGLYTGWSINLLKTVPTVTTTFVAYDLLKRQMGIYY